MLRGRPDSYSEKADYCPACGDKLICLRIPYLLQWYFHPVWIILPSILAAFFGLMIVLDVRGCTQEGRKQDAIAQQIADEKSSRIMATMPSEWKTLYAGMGGCHYASDRWLILRDYFKKNSEAMLPYLSPELIRLFLNIVQAGEQDDAFDLITDHMMKPSRRCIEE